MGGNRFPVLGPLVPQRDWGIGRWIGRAVYSAAGWSFGGDIPNISKAVIIVAPHTSNWDFVIGAAAMLAINLRARFIGKHTLFKGPLGVFMRWLGGIPIDRSQPGAGVIEEMASQFEGAEKLMLALAPEGTRSAVDRWKTGFHRIALAAGVPVVAVTLDWGRREIRFREPFQLTDDAAADIEVFQQWFSESRGRREQSSVSSVDN